MFWWAAWLLFLAMCQVMNPPPAPALPHSILEQGGITSAFYHAGMTPKQRMEVQNEWSSGEVQVVVATIAFGEQPRVRG